MGWRWGGRVAGRLPWVCGVPLQRPHVAAPADPLCMTQAAVPPWLGAQSAFPPLLPGHFSVVVLRPTVRPTFPHPVPQEVTESPLFTDGETDQIAVCS